MVDVVEGGAVEGVAGVVFLAGGVFGFEGEAGAVDHGGQGEALDDEGEDDDCGGCHRRPRLPHPPPTRPKSPSTGLILYQVLDQLQDLLSCWTGVCHTCQRPLPTRRSTNRTRQPAPT
ncbi:hypothetical protein [Kitasatospora sp. NPDC001683]